MKHCGTKRIETERLILRRFTPDDAGAMYRNWASDSEVTRFLTWPTHGSEEISRSLLEKWTESYSDDAYYQWAIVLKENGDEPIGSISGVRHDDRTDKVEIGYCIGKPWWHRGITSEALNAVIDFFFDQVGAIRVEAKHDKENPRSGMVMKKCGMKYEGTLRSADRNNQGICDVCIHSVLKDER
ncbi:MAG: GNAT family N-acetyltransferase [Oscillospiraceae bacterium]|nr:GNAT family N-acetyltransferase [Oscillospiraceae bacterium]